MQMPTFPASHIKYSIGQIALTLCFLVRFERPHPQPGPAATPRRPAEAEEGAGK